MCCDVLCCAVLCCAVLCCAVLCCAVLCCAVLCCAVLCCAVLCCAVLCCAVLCCRNDNICIQRSMLALGQRLLSTRARFSQAASKLVAWRTPRQWVGDGRSFPSTALSFLDVLTFNQAALFHSVGCRSFSISSNFVPHVVMLGEAALLHFVNRDDVLGSILDAWCYFGPGKKHRFPIAGQLYSAGKSYL